MTELDFEEDYYQILGVPESSQPEDIRKAYLKLAKKLHPDRFPNDDQGREAAQAEFRRVTQAHYILGDAERRQEYDRLRQLARARNLVNAAQPGDGTAAKTLESVNQSGGTTSITSEENINQRWAAKHLARADEYYRRHNYPDAEGAIKEAIRLVPNDAKYHNKLAEIYLARNWRTLALTEVQTSLRLDAKDPDARNLEAKIKATSRGERTTKSNKKGFLEQLKEMFAGKTKA